MESGQGIPGLGVRTECLRQLGDRGSKYLSAITLISGITDFSRLEQMKRRVQELVATPEIPKTPYADGVAERTAV